MADVMTLDCLEPGDRSADADCRILLNGDNSGTWTLSERGCLVSKFPDLTAALDSARHVPGSTTATIEIWQGGENICCLSPRECTHRRAAVRAGTVPPLGRLLTIPEQYANRAAQILLTTAGPLFWLALMLMAVAASLGWKLLLL
jgi:hypothetical protein